MLRGEEPIRHRRIHSSVSGTLVTTDQNNNSHSSEKKPTYQIDDLEYLTPTTIQTQPQVGETKSDHSHWKPQIRWPDTLVQIFLHTGALYGLYLLFFLRFYSVVWCKLPGA